MTILKSLKNEYKGGSIGVNYNQSKIENLITTSPTVFIADGGQFF